MKKLLLPFLVLCFLKINSQVVFCPPGAEWRYEFSVMIFINDVTNEKISYTGYTVTGGDTIKTLSHTKFYTFCNEYDVTTTSIKQKGDTVFFKNNKTQNTWQILYNFGSQVGQGWQTTILRGNNSPITFAYMVDSIGYVNINGFTLKRLYLNNKTTIITERIGNSAFLFNYSNSSSGSCDGDYFHEPLCYTDNAFGTKQFSNKPCNYANIMGLKNNTPNAAISLFPNPTSDKLNIHLETPDSEYQARVLDLLGHEMLFEKLAFDNSTEYQIDLIRLKPGLYFVNIYNENKLISTQKLLKQ